MEQNYVSFCKYNAFWTQPTEKHKSLLTELDFCGCFNNLAKCDGDHILCKKTLFYKTILVIVHFPKIESHKICIFF